MPGSPTSRQVASHPFSGTPLSHPLLASQLSAASVRGWDSAQEGEASPRQESVCRIRRRNSLTSESFLEEAAPQRPTLKETRKARAALAPSSFPFLLSPRAPTALRCFWRSTIASVFKIRTSASRPRMQPQLSWPLTPSRAPCPTRWCLSSVSSTALGAGGVGGGGASRGDRGEGHAPQRAELFALGAGSSQRPPGQT